jgi:hypothetical protein
VAGVWCRPEQSSAWRLGAGLSVNFVCATMRFLVLSRDQAPHSSQSSGRLSRLSRLVESGLVLMYGVARQSLAGQYFIFSIVAV